MKIIDKYVLREHLGPLLFALSALTSLLLLNYVAKQFGKLVGKGLGWDVIGEFFLLALPFTVAMTVPMAVLMCTLYAFSRMASENEITAFKASGVSIGRLMKPVIWASVLLAVVMIVFNDQVLPRSNHRLSQLQSDVLRKKPTFALREQVTNKVSDRLWLRAGHITPGTGAMREVIIYDFTDPEHSRTIYADSGTLAITPDQRDLALDLFDGVMQEFPRNAPGFAAAGRPPSDRGSAVYQQTFFGHARRLVRDVGNQLERSGGPQPKGERERTVCELQAGYVSASRDYAAAYEDMTRFARLAAAEGKTMEVPRRRTTYVRNGLGALYCRGLAALGISTAMAADLYASGQDRGGSAAAPEATQDPVPMAAAESTATTDTTADTTVAAAAPPDTATRTRLGVGSGIAPSMGGVEGVFEAASLRARMSLMAINSYDVEIHKKFALATACIVFVLLGAPIALRFPRGGVGAVIGVSIGVFALYYVGLIAGETVAKADYLPPFVTMWSANIIFTLVGLALLARAGRESSTARGGDLGDMADTARISLARLGRRVGLRSDRRRRAA
ncbi:MAG: LptF/LptG family permease [Gemmatimonadaceae bacterium]